MAQNISQVTAVKTNLNTLHD